MKSNLVSSLFLLVLLNIFSSFSAEPIRFDGKSQLISFNQNEQPSVEQLFSILKESGLNENYSLVLLNKENDLLGMLHFRYQETYKGNAIDGTMWIVHTMNGKIQSMNGVLVSNISGNASGKIAAEVAYKNALQFVSGNNINENFAANNLSSPEFFWVGENHSLNQFHKCYRFDIYIHNPLKREYIFVDMETGKIISSHNRIEEVNSTGTAITAYSGTQTITTDNTGSTYRLRETGRGNGVETYNMNNGTNYGTATDFTDADNTWNNVNAAKDQYATDGHWATEKTYDYYFLTYGRNSVDGVGLKLKSYVHANLVAMGYGNNVNAFWDGSVMTYGDGSSTINPLTTVDITGHEISHGVTQFTSNLDYQGESGALNEGFSDCMGTAIEFYAKPTTANWLIGNEIGATFRSMSNPNAYGQPDTYLGTNWYSGSSDNGGVHTNSGVLNYWFYLVSIGASGTNDNGNSFSVTGITISKAAAITYRMNSVYLTNTATYSDARTGAIQSAIDLYGACSDEVIQVTNAWYAVGVGAAFVSTPVVANFTAGASSSCTLPFTVQFTNTSTGGGSYSWTFGDGGTSSATNPSHIYTSFGNYTVTLINNGGTCGTNTKTSNNFITLQPSTAPIAPSVSRCGAGTVTLNASGNGTLNWFTVSSGGIPFNSGTTYTTPSLTSTATYYVESNTIPAPAFGGIPNNTVGTGGYFSNSTDRYLIFNCTQACTLVSTVVYASGAGNRTIQLRNSSGTVLQSLVANLADGQNTVTLNFSLPVANDMALAIGGTSNLYRNQSGAVYPYNIGSSVSITSSNSGTAGYYYYFYNWKIQEPGCISTRTVVQAIINPIPTSAITAGGPTTFCAGLNVVLTNSSSGLTYQWKKGTANITGATNSTYTATVTGSYTCFSSNSCGTATSNAISVTRLAIPTAIITLTGANPFCSSTTVTLTASSGTGVTYQWKNSNVNISGATNQVLVVTAAGNYKVVVTKTSTGCSKTSANKAMTTLTCREEENIPTSTIHAYPNPFTNTVTLQLNNIKSDRVEVIDITGRIVELKILDASSSIQLGKNLPSGFYVARLWKGNELIQNIKLVKTE